MILMKERERRETTGRLGDMMKSKNQVQPSTRMITKEGANQYRVHLSLPKY